MRESRFEKLLPEEESDAKDPATPPDRLRKLFEIVDREERNLSFDVQSDAWVRPYLAGHGRVGLALVQNPNTPLDLLVRLSEFYPAALARNPACALLLLEDPKVWEKFPPKAVAAMLKNPSLSEGLLASLAGSFPEEVALHPNCPRSFYEELLSRKDPMGRLMLASCPHTDPALLEAFARDGEALCHHDGEEYHLAVAQEVARNPAATTRMLSLIWEKRPACYASLARHPNTAPFILERLAAQRQLHEDLVRNPALPVSVVRGLLSYYEAQCEYQYRLSLSGRIKALLREPNDWRRKERWVVAQLLLSPSCPVEVLRAFSRSPTSKLDDVMFVLWLNPNTPEDALSRLRRRRDSFTNFLERPGPYESKEHFFEDYFWLRENNISGGWGYHFERRPIREQF